MPRKPRLDAPGLMQHVMARGVNKSNIFLNDKDRAVFLQKLGQVLREANSSCYAWVLMSNHFHLLLRTGDSPLAKVMNRLLGAYGGYFNGRYNRCGHLFQNRYKSIVVQEDVYFSELVLYIHLNPLKAGLVDTCKDLQSYRWSGHQALIGNKKYDWQDTAFTLDCLGGRRGYLSNLALSSGSDLDFESGGFSRSIQLLDIEEQNGASSDNRVLGSSEYLDSILKHIGYSFNTSDQLIDMLIEAVCEQFAVEPAALCGKSRNRLLSKARQVYSAIGIEYGLSAASIARTLNVSQAAIFKSIKKGKAIIATDPEIKPKIVIS